MNEEYVQRLLQEFPELRNEIQFIPPNPRASRGYWRFKPSSQLKPRLEGATKAQLDSRLKVWEAGYGAYGKKDIRDKDGKVVKKAMAEEVKKRTKGYRSPYRKTTWDKIWKMAKKALVAAAKRVEEREVEAT